MPKELLKNPLAGNTVGRRALDISGHRCDQLIHLKENLFFFFFVLFCKPVDGGASITGSVQYS
jgi:hypothetical protein